MSLDISILDWGLESQTHPARTRPYHPRQLSLSRAFEEIGRRRATWQTGEFLRRHSRIMRETQCNPIRRMALDGWQRTCETLTKDPREPVQASSRVSLVYVCTKLAFVEG